MNFFHSVKTEFQKAPLNSIGVLIATLSVLFQLKGVFLPGSSTDIEPFQTQTTPAGPRINENLIRWFFVTSALGYLVSWPCGKLGITKPFSGWVFSLFLSIFYAFLASYISAELLSTSVSITENEETLYYGLTVDHLSQIVAGIWVLLLLINTIPTLSKLTQNDPGGGKTFAAVITSLFGLLAMTSIIFGLFNTIYNGLVH